MFKRVIIAGVAAGLVAGSALAQTAGEPDTPAGPSANRFALYPVGDAFLKFDQINGTLSYCSERPVGWSCQLVPDERTAMEAEIARLQDEVAALKQRPADAAPPSGETSRPAPPLSDARPHMQWRLPNGEDMDRAARYAEQVWRRLVEMIGRLQNDAREKI